MYANALRSGRHPDTVKLNNPPWRFLLEAVEKKSVAPTAPQALGLANGSDNAGENGMGGLVLMRTRWRVPRA